LAKGGVLTEPTLAMMGEYAGAQTNPEIVAPQNVLQDIVNAGNEELIDVWLQTTQQIITAINGKDLSVILGDTEIAKSAARGNDNYKRQTGKSLFIAY
jgi:uncharacterized protein YidB (DUF937 family)